MVCKSELTEDKRARLVLGGWNSKRRSKQNVDAAVPPLVDEFLPVHPYLVHGVPQLVTSVRSSCNKINTN